jgi:pimeloyl-ACP methyl ester carboxylesterase
MTEFYDQDADSNSDSNTDRPIRRFIAMSLAFILVAGAAGYLYGFLSPSYEQQGKADLSVDSYMTQSVKWKSCKQDVFVPDDWQNKDFDADAAQCASFKVPASYSSEFGRDLPDLAIEVLKSPALDQANKLGTLYFNPGGPGGSGIEVVQFLEIPKEIRQKYDVVGFDPRGVGKSSPIRCDDTDTIDYFFETVSSPENEQEGQANSEWWQKTVEDCAKRNPNWWVMTTLNTVQDMDIMREVIGGDDKLNFVGMSYGTTLAVEYIRAFPDNAGRIVLDSVTSNDDEDYNQAELESTHKALTALFEMCAKDKKCPGDTVEEVEQIIFDAQDLANEGKLEGQAKYLSSDVPGSEFVVSDDELLYLGLFNYTYGSTEDSYPGFRDSMNELVKGDAWYFEYEALNYSGWSANDENEWERDNSIDILDIVNCLDMDSRDLSTKEEREEYDKRMAAADPFTSKFFSSDSGYVHVGERQGCQWSWLAFDDPEIPDPPDLMESPVNDSGQTFLVVSSKLDNVTPIENAQDTAKLLNSRLLTYEGSGHSPSFGGIKCIDDAIAKYFNDGYLPEDDIVCSVE